MLSPVTIVPGMYPATKRGRGPVRKYTLTMTLQGIDPPIWRMFDIPSNVSLQFLSDFLMSVMGYEWDNYYGFFKAGNWYSPYSNLDYGKVKHRYSIDKFALSDLLAENGDCMIYEFNSLGGWQHDLKLVSVAEYGKDEPKIIHYLGGERACPVEGSEGPEHYTQILSAFMKKKAGERLTPEEESDVDIYFYMKKDFEDKPNQFHIDRDLDYYSDRLCSRRKKS